MRGRSVNGGAGDRVPGAAELVRLLNAPIGDAALEAALRRLPKPEIRSSDGETYYSFRRSGISLLFDEESVLKSIFLYPAGRDGFGEYGGELPGGVGFRDLSQDVVRMLGTPTARGGGGKSAIYDVVPKWLRYDFAGHSAHFEFDPGTGSVSLVTIMAADTVPRASS